MTILSLPNEVLDIITGYLNAPQNTSGYTVFRMASTACLCKLDKIYAKDNEMYPMWREWKRDSLSLASVCKRLRERVFDQFWLQTATMEWTSKKLDNSRAVLGPSAVAIVETLILRGDCNIPSTPRPALKDYVVLFPRLRKIEIILVYPDVPYWEKPDKVDRGATTRQERAKSQSTIAFTKPPIAKPSLQSISLAVHKSNDFQGETHKHETKDIIHQFQSPDQLKQLKLKKLDRYHLEMTFSRSKRTAGDALFWRTFSNRVKEACVIPAQEVSICFGFQLLRDSAPFLNALSSGIKPWPKEIESIIFRVSLDDFAMARHKNVLNMIRVGKNNSVELIDGYLPSEKSMNGFLRALRKTRPNLRQFDLIIYCCDIPLTSKTSRQLFQYTYGTDSPGTSESTSPAGVYQVNQLALDNLHKFYLAQEEMFGSLGSDAEDDFEEEMEMMIEMQEEAAMF